MANDVLQNLFIAPGAVPPYTEATRTGNGWNCSLPSANAIAPLTAVPTTAAGFELFNNTAGAGAVNLIIDQIFAFHLLSVITVPYGSSLWAMVTTQKAVPSFTAMTVFSASGRQSYATLATGRVVTGTGTTVVANGWRPYGSVIANNVDAATPGESWSADINGRLIVPPGCSLCLHVVGSTITTNTFTMGASWYEAPLVNVP